MTKRTKKKRIIKLSPLRLGIMKQGPGDGVQFHFLKGQLVHKYLTPNDLHSCLAVYKATNITTVLGERVFVFLDNIRRIKCPEA